VVGEASRVERSGGVVRGEEGAPDEGQGYEEEPGENCRSEDQHRVWL
jgi:hypothetical protein